MLITKEQQEALVDKYVSENHNADQCIGFIYGINAILELISKIDNHNKENDEQEYCKCEHPTLGKSISRCGTCDEWFKPTK